MNIKKKKNKYKKTKFGTFYQLSPGDVEKDIARFNKNQNINTVSGNSESGDTSGAAVGESLNYMELFHGEKMNIIEKLNILDIKALDDGKYLDLRNMYEAVAPRMSAQTKTELKNLLSTTDDYDAVQAFINTKMQKNEDLTEAVALFDRESIETALDSACEFIFYKEGPEKVEELLTKYGLHPDEENLWQDNEDEEALKSAYRDFEDYLNRYVKANHPEELYGIDKFFNLELNEDYINESLNESLNGSLETFYPEEFVEKCKSAESSLFTDRGFDGVTYSISLNFPTFGSVENPKWILVSVIDEDADKYIINKKVDTYDEAISLLNNFKDSVINNTEDKLEVQEEALETDVDESLNEASFGPYNYKYSVRYSTPSKPDVLFGGSNDLESAQEQARKCAKQIFENPFESSKNKFNILDSIYISNDDEEDDDCMSFETEDYIDNLMSELHSKKESLEEDVKSFTKEELEDAIISACEYLYNYENHSDEDLSKMLSSYGLHPDNTNMFSENESYDDLLKAFTGLKEYLHTTCDFSDDIDAEVIKYFGDKLTNESLNEDLFIMAIPSLEDFASSVIAAYQNATKWLDTIKEMIYHDHSCVFFSDYIHRLAHSMPERFDKFGDILHTADIKIEYPETKELENVPSTPEEAIDKTIEILNQIKGSLNNFRKSVDESNHSMACATEDLMMDIDVEYTPLFRMRKALENCSGDYASFDKWVHQYVENKDKLTESLNEDVDDESIVDRFFNDLDNNVISDKELDFIIPTEDEILNELNPSVVSRGFAAKTYGPADDSYPGEGPEFDVTYDDFEDVMIDGFVAGLCYYYKCNETKDIVKDVTDNISDLKDLCDTSIYDENSLYDYLCDHYLDNDYDDWD